MNLSLHSWFLCLNPQAPAHIGDPHTPSRGDGNKSSIRRKKEKVGKQGER